MLLRIARSAVVLYFLVEIATAVGMASSGEVTSPTFTSIDYPNAQCTFLEDVNNGGEIVGRHWGPETAFSYRGFLYRGGNFLTVDFPGAFSSGARGINELGDIVGFYQADAANNGFLYAGGTFTSIHVPDFPFITFAEGINNFGTIVGFAGDLGFVYTGGTFTPLRLPRTFWLQASDVNDSDAIVGSYLDEFGLHGFLYTGGVYSALDVPGSSAPGYGKYSIAMGISNTGVIVGGYFEGEFVHHGFLYENGIFSTIDIPGATYTIATGVNDSGDVVGYYLDASSECHGFLVNTIPVVVDVKPDSPSNTVNLRSRGVTPVAILSSSSFDAQEINPATVTLAGARVDQQNNSGKLRCSTEDVNGDGLVDLVCKIVSDQLMVEAGHNVVVLRGQTFGGQLIRGEDVIRPVSE